MTTAASAGCYNCYTPPPCTTCYQQQYVQPQYRTVDETVMVSPGSVVAHRAPAQYRTVMVPQTVMVAPPSVQYERIPPQYATRQRVEMVQPGYSYYAPVQMGCACLRLLSRGSNEELHAALPTGRRFAFESSKRGPETEMNPDRASQPATPWEMSPVSGWLRRTG
ncbi:hypothetical protein ACVW1A_006823 [Bradyrhizobium sp. LB1.3]